MPADTAEASQLAIERDGRDLRVKIAGDWKLQSGQRPDPKPVYDAIDQQQGGALSFDASGLGEWDSSLLVFLLGCEERCRTRKIDFRCDTLPPEIDKLIALSEEVPERQTGRGEQARQSVVQRLGKWAQGILLGGVEFLHFLGESILSLLHVIRRRDTFNGRDFWVTLQETSIAALPIVSLISFLTGLILAFVGAVQLEKFGASIYVANLVGLGMVREMGALMTAIIMAGRTGAAFAAQIGSMKVNEEIDALKTLGIPPQDFLVTPRVLALFLMMPLLCLYADVIGIAGGATVGLGMLKLSWTQFIHQTEAAIKLLDIGTGLLKSVVFGGIVAITGCLRGIQCGDNASAVGLAATSAVVTGITLIVFADAVFDVIFNTLGI